MGQFISEDDLGVFEGWLMYQGIDLTTATEEVRADWRATFDEARERALATPKVGLMKLKDVPGVCRYAVAIREGDELLLCLWVQRSRRGEFFILYPCVDPNWNPSRELPPRRPISSEVILRHKAGAARASPAAKRSFSRWRTSWGVFGLRTKWSDLRPRSLLGGYGSSTSRVGTAPR